MAPKGGVLAIAQMQKLVLSCIFVIDILQGLLCVEESVACKQIEGLGVVDFELVLYDHDELEDGERLDDKDPIWWRGYLLLSNSFSLLCLTLFRKIGILSG